MKKFAIYATVTSLMLWLLLSGIGKLMNSVRADMDRRSAKIVSSL